MNKCPQYQEEFPEPEAAETETAPQEHNTQESDQPQKDEWVITNNDEWGDLPVVNAAYGTGTRQTNTLTYANPMITITK